MPLSQPIDCSRWDWTWAWYPLNRNFAELQSQLAARDIRMSEPVVDITEEYVECHRVLMHIAGVVESDNSGFTKSARIRADRWKPMLLAHFEFETFRFPIVCCTEFLNINLLSVESQCRGQIIETMSIALAVEPKWDWGNNHRIWWCVDGAAPERLDYFRGI